jgi:hypothetical protein
MPYSERERIYGKWVSIQRLPDDPHSLLLTLYRNKPMEQMCIDGINKNLNENECILIVLSERKSPLQEAIEAAEFDKKQRKIA